MSNKIKIALTVSIILNFLFAGLLIGNLSKSYLYEKSDHNHFEKITEKLPAEKHELVMGRIETLKEEHRKVREDIKNTKKQIADILRAPEFDEELYENKISEMHDLYRGKAKNMANTIKELAVQFTPEERAVLAEMLEKKHKKHWKKYQKH